jgi:DNA-binding CsgD family transcriptional regulator
MKERDLAELLSSSSDPAFVIGSQGTIRYWNSAAERVFGRSAGEVVSQPCTRILASNHTSGAPFCSAECPLLESAMAGMPTPAVELSVAVAGGAQRIMRFCSLIAHNQNGEPLLVHLLHDVDSQHRLNAAVHHFLAEVTALSQTPEGCPALGMQLTSREKLILEMLAEGRSTSSIAKQLKISSATVRNHIQHVLHKLSAHSRLQAVLRAVREHLV